jgi:hypothetical protein
VYILLQREVERMRRVEYYETFPKDEIRKMAEEGYWIGVRYYHGLEEPWRLEYTKIRGPGASQAHEPEWLSEALNEGDGTYSP